MMIRVLPSDMTLITAVCRTTLERFVSVRKCGSRCIMRTLPFERGEAHDPPAPRPGNSPLTQPCRITSVRFPEATTGTAAPARAICSRSSAACSVRGRIGDVLLTLRAQFEEE